MSQALASLPGGTSVLLYDDGRLAALDLAAAFPPRGGAPWALTGSMAVFAHPGVSDAGIKNLAFLASLTVRAFRACASTSFIALCATVMPDVLVCPHI